ncbi:MAG: hypothetical protein HUJ63_12860 [Enterococcus sp.]|nr:hypothetical protein [Enterococcus sp.]
MTEKKINLISQTTDDMELDNETLEEISGGGDIRISPKAGRLSLCDFDFKKLRESAVPVRREALIRMFGEDICFTSKGILVGK